MIMRGDCEVLVLLLVDWEIVVVNVTAPVPLSLVRTRVAVAWHAVPQIAPILSECGVELAGHLV